ncbi:DgyrCDS4880 [Dimorphilus gyrociliatus]|uniref:Origin recognition complex subunit 2 n=1 Tax=Dimorphilus gyrociliatus TaxID=2664684 RepID=A0A7I8VIT4_9ANNE|nr:DgyrCDS4880 [Dimorphilus gyrociliatus]
MDIDDIEKEYEKWFFFLAKGFNVLVQGSGSKRSLIENFRTKHLIDYDTLVINGFFPSLSIKQILRDICKELLDIDVPTGKPENICDEIVSTLKTAERDIILIIHNIDGPNLRNFKIQNIFSQLSRSNRVKIVCSIDHPNAHLLWDNVRMTNLKFATFKVDTNEDYSVEQSYEKSTAKRNAQLSVSAANHVLSSLTPNAIKIFFLLAEHQLEHGNEEDYNGLSFTDLYSQCRREFLVNSDLTLRTQLIEFKDHKLIKLKKGVDGAEMLTISLDDESLKEVMENNH